VSQLDLLFALRQQQLLPQPHLQQVRQLQRVQQLPNLQQQQLRGVPAGLLPNWGQLQPVLKQLQHLLSQQHQLHLVRSGVFPQWQHLPALPTPLPQLHQQHCMYRVQTGLLPRCSQLPALPLLLLTVLGVGQHLLPLQYRLLPSGYHLLPLLKRLCLLLQLHGMSVLHDGALSRRGFLLSLLLLPAPAVPELRVFPVLVVFCGVLAQQQCLCQLF
jgi:hypothetical protein